MNTFRIRTLRPARIDGRVVAAGVVALVDARQAAALIEAEAAVLTDDAQLLELARALSPINGARRSPLVQ